MMKVNKCVLFIVLSVFLILSIGGCKKKSTPADKEQTSINKVTDETLTSVEDLSKEETDEESVAASGETSDAESTGEEQQSTTSEEIITSSNISQNNESTQQSTTVQEPTNISNAGYKGLTGMTATEFGLYYFEENDLKTADEIIRGLGVTNASNYDKAKAVIDWLCINCHQFDESLNSWDTNSAHSIFSKKIGLCNGYSEAFYVMMTELGVPCEKITGTVGTASHAWITVKMDDGKWYYIDANNTDENVDGKYGDDPTGANISYRLFLMPYSEMGMYHPVQTMPTPYGTSYEYQNKAILTQNKAAISELKQQYLNMGMNVIELGGKDTIASDMLNAMKGLKSGKKYVFVSEVSTKGMEINWYAAAKQLYAQMPVYPENTSFFIMSNTNTIDLRNKAYALEFTYIDQTKEPLEGGCAYLWIDTDGSVRDTNSYYTQDY